MVEITKIGVMPFAKMLAAIYVGIGLLIGLFVAVLALFGAALPSSGTSFPGLFGLMFGVGAVIFFPIMYGIMGLVIGALMALLYNFIAPKIGGIKLETK